MEHPRALRGGRARRAATKSQPRIEGARQDKTRQDETRRDETRQDKTRQDEARQDKTRQDKTRQDETRQDKTRQDKTRQDKTKTHSPPDRRARRRHRRVLGKDAEAVAARAQTRGDGDVELVVRRRGGAIPRLARAPQVAESKDHGVGVADRRRQLRAAVRKAVIEVGEVRVGRDERDAVSRARADDVVVVVLVVVGSAAAALFATSAGHDHGRGRDVGVVVRDDVGEDRVVRERELERRVGGADGRGWEAAREALAVRRGDVAVDAAGRGGGSAGGGVGEGERDRGEVGVAGCAFRVWLQFSSVGVARLKKIQLSKRTTLAAN